MVKTVLGIIGGSGLYDLPMDNAKWVDVESSFGAPSDQLRMGEISGLPVVFLPRHSAINELVNDNKCPRRQVFPQ
jgi:5'-methylthioadenosine phosphorylase